MRVTGRRLRPPCARRTKRSASMPAQVEILGDPARVSHQQRLSRSRRWSDSLTIPWISLELRNTAGGGGRGLRSTARFLMDPSNHQRRLVSWIAGRCPLGAQVPRDALAAGSARVGSRVLHLGRDRRDASKPVPASWRVTGQAQQDSRPAMGLIALLLSLVLDAFPAAAPPGRARFVVTGARSGSARRGDRRRPASPGERTGSCCHGSGRRT